MYIGAEGRRARSREFGLILAASAVVAFAAPPFCYANNPPPATSLDASAQLHELGERSTEVSAGSGGVWGETPQASALDVAAQRATSFDLGSFLGWSGVTLHINSYKVKARELGNDYASRVIAPGGTPSARRTTVWIEQHLLDNRVSVRAGQIAADEEFFIAPSGLNFVNTTFGLPASMAANLPGSGPLYPLAAPGVRLRADMKDGLSFLSAVFRGDPAARPSLIDPLLRNPGGSLFAVDGSTFAISEAQYTTAFGALRLPGTYKFGAWYHTGEFDDMHLDSLGGSLAAAGTTGIAKQHEGNFGIYGIANQRIWRPAGKADQGLDLFLKAGSAPSDRNPIDFFVDGGAGYTGLIPGRSNDFLGLAIAYAQISNSVQQLNRDSLALDGISGSARDHDAVVELTYRAQLAPGWSVQPGVQYVFSPGADMADAADPGATLSASNALVVGVRATLTQLNW